MMIVISYFSLILCQNSQLDQLSEDRMTGLQVYKLLPLNSSSLLIYIEVIYGFVFSMLGCLLYQIGKNMSPGLYISNGNQAMGIKKRYYFLELQYKLVYDRKLYTFIVIYMKCRS